MNCQSLIDKFLYDYHAGTLPLGRRVEFEVHLKLCGPCRKYLASYRKTVELAKGVATATKEEPVPVELVEAILAVTRGKGNDKVTR